MDKHERVGTVEGRWGKEKLQYGRCPSSIRKTNSVTEHTYKMDSMLIKIARVSLLKEMDRFQSNNALQKQLPGALIFLGACYEKSFKT